MIARRFLDVVAPYMNAGMNRQTWSKARWKAI
jgi:hypothetical protein